jgi:hypothetical protein
MIGALRWAAERRSSLWRFFIWLVLVWALLPHQLLHLSPGVDPSWVWGINHVSETGAVPGADYAYTYGPLGSFVWSVAGGPHLQAAAVVRLLLHALFAAVLALALRRRPAAQVGGFALAVLVSAGLGSLYEIQLLFWLALLFAAGIAGERMRRVAGPLGAALAVLFLLMKVSLGVCALVLLAGFALWLGAVRKAWREVAVLGLAWLSCAALAVALAFGSWRSAGLWLGAQREFLAGMSVAMSLEGPGPELAAAILCLAAFSALAAYAVWSGGRAAAFLALAVPVAGLVFRHGFVRQDNHVVIFFATVIAFLAIGILFAGSARELAAAAGVAIAVIAAGAGTASAYERAGAESFAAALDALVHPAAAARLVRTMLAGGPAARPRRALAAEALPADWLAPLRAANTTFDAVPQELTLLAANRLRWIPSPTLQLYIAYTAALDARCAAHFAGARAPDLLLLRYDSIDGRNPLWDPPAAWAAILQHYSAAPSPLPDLFVLRRRAAPQTWRWRDAGRLRFSVGDWIEVPAAPDLLFGVLDLRLTVAGRLQANLFRVPPIFAAVDFADGHRKRWRIVPDTARDGLLLNPLPRNSFSLPALFAAGPFQGDPDARAPTRAVRLQIAGPGTRCFEDEGTITWRMAERQWP